MDMKPPEKDSKENEKKLSEKKLQAEIGERKTSYRHYKDAEKEQLFMLVKENEMSVRAAAFALNINVRTTECWVAKGRKGPIRLYSKISW
jgi:transposase-like protein